MEIIQEKTVVELSFATKYFDVGESNFHWHKNYELLYLPEKSCDFWVDGEVIRANKGDIIAIEEHIVHKFLAQSHSTPVLIMQFQPKILLNTNVSTFPLRTHISAQEIEDIPQLNQKIDSLLSLATDEESVPDTNDNLFLQSLFVTLYLLLMRYFPSSKIHSASRKDRIDFYQITEFVNENFAENINIKELSSILFMSKRRISSLFAKYTGTSLNDYINQLRIKNANKLLDSGSSVTEAAFASGFQCIRTFNNVYKEQMNITPSEYIKKSSLS